MVSFIFPLFLWIPDFGVTQYLFQIYNGSFFLNSGLEAQEYTEYYVLTESKMRNILLVNSF